MEIPYSKQWHSYPYPSIRVAFVPLNAVKSDPGWTAKAWRNKQKSKDTTSDPDRTTTGGQTPQQNQINHGGRKNISLQWLKHKSLKMYQN